MAFHSTQPYAINISDRTVEDGEKITTDLRVTFLVFCGGVGVPSSPKYRLRFGASLTMDKGSGPITSVMHDIWST